MKKNSSVLLPLGGIAGALLAAVSFQAFAAGSQQAPAPGKETGCQTCRSLQKAAAAAPGVKNLNSLTGCWTGQGPGGVKTEISYEIGSGRSALLETQWVEKQPPIYTVYYMDGNNLTAHHFCSYGNQIRLRAERSSDPKVLRFAFVDASNLPDRNHDHMNSVKFTFRDRDHFDMEWGLHRGGKDMPQPFTYTRATRGCTVGYANRWSAEGR
jgi:hypothetical protein